MSELPPRGAVIGGRYRIESLLGHGGMGAVFGATNLATGREVAIKWLLPDASLTEDAIARFLVEARATAKIDHPNVIGILDAGADHGAPFLVMELLRGESFGARIRREGRLHPLVALDVMIAACRGLAEAHREGVLHRDLKPDNIFLCAGKDGTQREPKVLDFGVSKLYQTDTGPRITKTGISMGTPEYMAPEQIQRPRDVDARIDVYAIGVVLYEALAGRRPYDGGGLSALAIAITTGRAPPLSSFAPDVPPPLEAVVRRAMTPNRDARPQSMYALLAELEAVRAQLGAPQVVPQVVSYAAPPPSSRMPLLLALVAAVGVLVLLGMVGIGFLWWRTSRDGPVHADTPISSDESETNSPSEPPGPPGDPLRPRIELTLSGTCAPQFTGRLRVSTGSLGWIELASFDGSNRIGWLVIRPGPLPGLSGTLDVTAGFFVQIAAEHTGNTWNNFVQGGMLGGTMTFQRFEAASGAMDVTFNDVTLVHPTQGPCFIRGRVRTFGLTEG